MSVNIFTAIVLLCGFFSSSAAALHWQLLFCLFGAAEAVGLPALGGSSINPAVLFMPFMLLRASTERPSALQLGKLPPAGFLLLAFATWGALSAALLPRAFESQTLVLAIDRGSSEVGVVLSSLRPVSGNLTQPIYGIGNAFVFLGIYALLARKGRFEDFRNAALLLGALDVLAGVINLAEGAGMPPVLEYVRTGGYAQFGLAPPGSRVRIQGTFSETSWFSGFTLPLFAFAVNLWIGRSRERYSGMVALSSLALLLMSTSGTAYAGLAMYLPYLGGTLLWRARNTGKIQRAEVFTIGLMAVVLVIGGLFLFELDAATTLSQFFEDTVGNKMESESGIERASWNRQAWVNFLDTYGVGIGLGSSRASSLVMALLSNVGVIGTTLFVAFVARIMRPPAKTVPNSLAVIKRAAQHAAMATILCAATSGTTCDLGVAFYVFAAAAAANPNRYLNWPPPPATDPAALYAPQEALT
jgi:hypothetical protein